MSERSIVLTGFMATGKTAVGRELARLLGRRFVDMDEVIEAREGQAIRDIFRARGEGYFRQLESALCAELGTQEGLVIATGGGSLVNPENRARFAGAFVVCLEATAAALVARVGDARDRPMLAGGATPAERVEELLAARRPAYDRIAAHVDTTDKTVEEVAAEVAALYARAAVAAPQPGDEANLTPCPASLRGKGEREGKSQGQAAGLGVATPEGDYPIHLGAGLLAETGRVLAEMGGFSRRCAVVTNPTVGGLYAERVVESLRGSGFDPHVIEVPEGERHKTLATVSGVYDRLVELRLDRRSPLLALGGGVVGDLAGFAAATFLRGVPFVQLPTTLLAMVDSSVGGKVAVDHAGGKNLIGAFKQPRAVLADTRTLATLPASEWRCGLAETVKHAVIGDAALFARLEAAADCRATVDDWLGASIAVKVAIVGRDPYEQGERLKLNLGHTFGHALEVVANYELPHGDAVAIGLACAARLAWRLGLCESEFERRLGGLMARLGLPTRVPAGYAAADILAAMQADKKRLDGRLRFVLPRGLEDVAIVGDIAREDVAAAIEETRDRSG